MVARLLILLKLVKCPCLQADSIRAVVFNTVIIYGNSWTWNNRKGDHQITSIKAMYHWNNSTEILRVWSFLQHNNIKVMRQLHYIEFLCNMSIFLCLQFFDDVCILIICTDDNLISSTFAFHGFLIYQKLQVNCNSMYIIFDDVFAIIL